MYADETYYNNTYLGIAIDSTELTRMLARASDYIDMLTNYKLKAIDINTLDPFFQDQIKKATCAQVEVWQKQGGIDVVGAGYDSVNIGNFSYSGGSGSSGSDSSQSQVDANVIGYLKPTGLLYSGVSRYGY